MFWRILAHALAPNNDSRDAGSVRQVLSRSTMPGAIVKGEGSTDRQMRQNINPDRAAQL